MRNNIGIDVGVAAWFVLVGVMGTLYPPSSPTAGVIGFALAVVIVPALTLAVGAYGIDPWRARWAAHPLPRPARVPVWRRCASVLPTLFGSCPHSGEQR